MSNEVNERTWDEFAESGMFWWINMILHTFGWALLREIDGDSKTIRVYPSRVKFRGFETDVNTRGYKKISKYMKEYAIQLDKEANE